MRENTPPQSPYHDIEEDLIELNDAEEILADQPEEVLAYPELELDSDLESLVSDDSDPDKETRGEDSLLIFEQHAAAVFACSLHPTQELAVSGGEDDMAYVWNIETGEVVFDIKNHTDTVLAASFSFDGVYMVTADMAGEIQVFRVRANYKKVWSYSMGDMCWMRWHGGAHVLFAGSDNGEIYVWRIPSGECKILPGNGTRCESGELTTDGKKILVGYGDGTVKLWDIKNSTGLFEVKSTDAFGHKECVSGVSCAGDRSLYMSGSEDGKVLLMNNSGPVCILDPNAGPVEVVAFCNEEQSGLAASATLNGTIHIWDVERQTARAICERIQEHEGVTAMKWLPDKTLVCGTIRGNIYGFDGRTGKRKFLLEGHSSEIYDMTFDRGRNILVSASEDNTVRIFKDFL